MSRMDFILSSVEHGNCFITIGPGLLAKTLKTGFLKMKLK